MGHLFTARCVIRSGMLFRRSFKISFLLGAELLILVLLISAISAWMSLPKVGVLKTRFPVVEYQGPDDPPIVEIRKGRPSGWTSLSEISQLATAAILISEDSAFYQHHGYDPGQIREALETDLEEHRFARGASTITQQVVKNVFLTRDKNLWRKAKELYLATELDRTVPKRRVLEIYMNIAEWGPGIFGIRAASRYYFQKTPGELTAKEGAFLAMLLPSPIRYGQSFRQRHLTDFAAEEINDILDKMVHAHHLTEEEKTAELNQPLSFETLKTDSL